MGCALGWPVLDAKGSTLKRSSDVDTALDRARDSVSQSTWEAKTMSLLTVPRAAIAGVLLSGSIAFAAAPAFATPTEGGSFEIVFPADTVCPGFALTVDGSGGKRVDHSFTDADGNVVRTLSTGTGSALTFSNGNNSV